LRPAKVAQRTFSVAPRPPFRLDLTVWALRRRPDNTIDRWDGHTYRRALPLETGGIELAAVQAGSAAVPDLTVTLTGAQLDEQTEEAARAALARLLGLELDLSKFYRLAAGDPFLQALADRFRGLKPPRFPTLFECLVNAIACQQFPLPTQLADLSPDALRPLGFSSAKSRSIIELAARIGTGMFDAAAIETLDDDAALTALLRLRGVGRWTAEYALLRGLGRLHIFPGDDVGARNNLARWLDRREPLDYAGVQAAVRGWQPFAGLVYFHLLLANLTDHGILAESSLTRSSDGVDGLRGVSGR
jgi:DNA-3-methyladenine glycosylase II